MLGFHCAYVCAPTYARTHSFTERRSSNFPHAVSCRHLICATLIHVPPPPFLCTSNSTHSILPHGRYFLVLRLIETAFELSRDPKLDSGSNTPCRVRVGVLLRATAGPETGFSHTVPCTCWSFAACNCWARNSIFPAGNFQSRANGH